MAILDEVRSPALPSPQPVAATGGTTARQPLSTRLATKLGSLLLARTSRRGFLATTAMAGTALATAPRTFALTPTTAYASVCGDGSSCSSGWTAFCCTINAGKNTCPPGSLAGGWWKADGSGFCCGKARYIVDCHYTCTNCSAGCGAYKSICNQGCHPGSCTCATGDCDKRRTNCNKFRYGQCNTQISCVGPVLCRVVSCTPPWQLYSCTTSSATDNRTGNHSASCLPGQGCLPTIDQWWWDRGGPGSVMGGYVDGGVSDLGGGNTKRTFANGTVYNLAGTGIVLVKNPVDTRYRAAGAHTSALGLPLANAETGPDGGVFQRFAGGMITWLAPKTDIVLISGTNYTRFTGLGGLKALGYPTSLGRSVDGGLRDTFLTCHVYTRGGVSYPVSGGILSQYVSLGETGGALGWPTSLSYPTNLKHFRGTTPVTDPTTRAQDFEHGRIVLAQGGPRVEYF